MIENKQNAFIWLIALFMAVFGLSYIVKDEVDINSSIKVSLKADAALKDVVYESINTGKHRLLIKAKEGNFIKKNNAIIAKGVSLLIYRDASCRQGIENNYTPILRLTSNEASFDIQAKSASFYGSVRGLINGDGALATDKLFYNPSEEVIKTKSDFVFTMNDMLLKGKGFLYYFKSGRLKVNDADITISN